MPVRPEASQALADLIREYGKSIIKMPSSCQMYMTVKLADFPAEKDLFADALRRGIPEQILQHAGSDDYAIKLAAMSREIAKAKGIEPEMAVSVVTAWAEALNRPVGYQKAVVPDRVYQDAPPPDPRKEKTVRLVMAMISGAGGFLGCALGAGLPGIIMLITEVAVGDTRVRSGEYPTTSHSDFVTTMAIAIAVKMLITGVAGGFGGFFGWLLGKGDQKPWAGFAASFGAGFTITLIFLFRASTLVNFWRNALVIKLSIITGTVFGAAYTAAARGGHTT